MAQRQASAMFIFFSLSGIFTAITFYLFLNYATAITAYLLALNLSTFLLYAYDKFISSHNTLRVPENLLHLLAILGGSPASLLAQHLFRHKVSKASFLRVFWTIVLLQGLALWYFNVI